MDEILRREFYLFRYFTIIRFMNCDARACVGEALKEYKCIATINLFVEQLLGEEYGFEATNLLGRSALSEN